MPTHVSTHRGQGLRNIIPRNLKLIGTILTLIVGILGSILAIAKFYPDFRDLIQRIHPKPVIPALPAYQLVDPIIKSPPELPFRFLPLIGSSTPYLKWIHIQLTNRSAKRVHVKVYFRVASGPATGKAPVSWEESLEPKEHIQDWITPNLELLQSDVEIPKDLLLFCEVLDDEDHIIKEVTRTIRLLPNNMMDWTLVDPDERRVPQKFLLASLALWITSPDSRITKEQKRLGGSTGQPVEPATLDQWFARSYDKLFRDQRAVVVIDSPIAFPAAGRQTIRTPSQVLNGSGDVDSLEAALLLGALARASFVNKVKLLLLAIPEPDRPPSNYKNILLSWSRDSVNWRAVNLAKANRAHFKDNERVSTQSVVTMLKNRPEIQRALADTGMFFSGPSNVVALDFIHAGSYFGLISQQ